MQVFEDLNNINWRKQLYELLRGTDNTPGIGQLMIIRKARTNPDGSYVRCVCYDETTGEGAEKCTYCKGLGYLFDDKLILGYLFNQSALSNSSEEIILPGVIEKDKFYIICEYWVNPSEKDIIFELDYNTEYTGQQPVKVYRTWEITSINPFRGDYGRIEYFQLNIETYRRKKRIEN